MAVIVHGTAGHSLAVADDRYGDDRRRGEYFERQVGAALQHWLESRPDELHLFHDLCGFVNVTGAGKPPLSLGTRNIDHLILAGSTWLMIDAKGCGAGELRVVNGRGVLVQADSVRPQPWMDNQHHYSLAGVPYRLTGGRPGKRAIVLPDVTGCDPRSVSRARFASLGDLHIANLSEVAGGGFDFLLPAPQPPANRAVVTRFTSYLSDKVMIDQAHP